MRFILLIFSFAVFSPPLQTQVRVIKFPELQSMMDNNKDTPLNQNIWATRSKPCVAALPNFQQLTKSYSNAKLKVVFVSLDF